MVRFTELNPLAFEGAILFVDVDGTITNDRNPAFELSAKQQLRALGEHTLVYLCSNGRKNSDHLRELARETGSVYIETPYKKPDARILDLIPDRAGKRLIVIGDKYLTDGRFGKNIGALYVPFARMT